MTLRGRQGGGNTPQREDLVSREPQGESVTFSRRDRDVQRGRRDSGTSILGQPPRLRGEGPSRVGRHAEPKRPVPREGRRIAKRR